MYLYRMESGEESPPLFSSALNHAHLANRSAARIPPYRDHRVRMPPVLHSISLRQPVPEADTHTGGMGWTTNCVSAVQGRT